MPRKAYQADLKKASQGVDSAGISHVRTGDDDGEFKVRITPEAGAPFEISALIPDLSDYPTDHMYQIFLADDDAPAFVGETLERLPNTQGRTIEALLEVLSKTFVRSDKEGDALMLDSQAEDFDDDEVFGADSSDDEAFDLDGHARPSLQHLSTARTSAKSTTTAKFRDRIRADLNLAKASGFKVGAFGGLLQGDSCYVTLSCRVSKLGISEEAIEAWQLRGNEYLILLIHYPNGYKCLDTLEGYDASGARRNIEFRVGCSNNYKPTVQETVMAFANLPSNKQKTQGDSQFLLDTTTKGFRENFISKPLNQLFNERLPTIIRYRMTGMSWTGAEKFFNNYQGKNVGVDGSDFMDSAYMSADVVSKAFPPLVTSDHLTDASEPHSLPLLAMQFLLRHFVRCTEFCLVCHCKLDIDLEAIKPYVCDKPLCLYQYMSLGFGPSIEHEITSQPYVVDLLLSFCYSQAAASRLKELPTGLSLSVPDFSPTRSKGTGADAALGKGMRGARYNATSGEILFEKGQNAPFNNGDWLMLQFIDQKETRVFHCRVKDMTYFPTIELSEPVMAPSSTNHLYQNQNQYPYGSVPATAGSKANGKSTETPTSGLHVDAGFHEILFHRYDQNFDTLKSQDQSEAILRLLELIPPVAQLRDYLLQHPDRTLSGWHDRLSPSMLGVLRWIIASNRACIMQPSSSGKKCDYRVHGMKDWMQFRFAMGAPDKERRFIDAVQTTSQRKKLTCSTIYAWHGSPLFNWHSIIREGLHFKNADHGRAYGNGVYHSLDFHTSSGYSSFYFNTGAGQESYGNSWPNSELKISTAMALNEIVNAPDEFVSRTPHLVVDQIDWIQTRFLFVRVNTEAKLFGQEENSAEFHVQDPNFTPKGENGSIKIPLNATRAGRTAKAETKSAPKKHTTRSLFSSKRGTANDPITFDDDDESVITEDDDRNILLDDDVQIISSQKTVKDKDASAVVEGFKSIFGSKGSSSKPSKPLTDFVPGSLDHNNLPLLQQPQFATNGATKRLQKDFQSLVRLQQSAAAENTLHELGWWTDPEMFNNVYQWIVELHSFEQSLPLAKQMKQKGIKSIVMEMRFGQDYPMTPPFIRVIRPRFRSFMAGGGGHVTAGGSLCMELLTNSGWSAVSSIESVLLQVRMALSSTDPRPAQLENGIASDYPVSEAIEAYIRACQTHGWRVPDNFRQMAWGGQPAGPQY